MTIKLIFLVWLIKQLSVVAEASDVVGCGGFIKSHVPIDFSNVEVKLVTKQGIIKDRTNCAPNNGYYFLPLYDKGELKLELSPPPGWSFTPKEINLNFDGTDPCSQGKDINFVFEGFGIAGKVESLGGTGGSQGITVNLVSKEGTRATQTEQGGSFSFSPVYPGTYTVSISHPKWKIYKGTLIVEVKETNTELPKNSLVVQGYDVIGKVLSANGNPVQNTLVALFGQKSNKNILVDGCNKRGDLNIKPKELYLCHVTTTSNGEFKFPVVPSGDYFVLPYYKEENVYFEPSKIAFSVQYTSVQLNENFKVLGFTVPGKVINSKNEAIPNASIFVNGEKVTHTDKFGKYKLENVKVGTYQLKAEADNLIFNEMSVTIGEKTIDIDKNLIPLPDLVPSLYRVCGKVLSDQPQSIVFAQIGSTKLIEAATNQYQEFCQYLPSGQYDVSVKTRREDEQSGLLFFPVTQKLEIPSVGKVDLVFSQLKSSFVGSVKCIQKKDCDDLIVTLRSNSEELVLPVKDSVYSATDIHPGLYEITLSKNKLCWQTEKQTINIDTTQMEIPAFIQSGYQLQFVSSHDAVITYKTIAEGKLLELPINRGVTNTCLNAPGQYSFKINSCHEFESDTVAYSTSSENNEITLNAQKHTVTTLIQSDKHDPIEVSIKIGEEEIKETVKHSGNGYEIKLMLKPFEVATITPKSDKLFFAPQSTLEVQGQTDCRRLENDFYAVPGKVFQGQIQPPLADVIITVEDLNYNKKYVQTTDLKGTYKFAPLYSNHEYEISAQKDSYVFTGPDNKGNFVAQKLAEISVEVVDENSKVPLTGVLLSLSGGESYRRNLQTESNRVVFHSLSAGDYYLRPLMKEYKFEPASKLITVKEGETVNVRLTGKRVAFSAFGKLTTVNEDPAENVNVIASGLHNCSGLSEQATTGASGSFRIRGLQPYCSFKIYVQVGSDHLSLVERTSPESIEIKNIDKDVENLHITVFRPVLITDVLVKVQAEKVEHYRFLKLTLYRESPNPSVLYSTSIESLNIKVDKSRNHGVLIHFPSLILDNNDYSVHLEPSHNIKGGTQVEYFNANSSFKYLEMHFNPKTTTREQPIKQSSIWAMLLILVILLLAYNIQTVLNLLREHLNFNTDVLSSYIPIPRNTKSINTYDNDIDQIVQDINNVKKHKPKKTN